jgi:thiosulfate reductase cytochrome b subunit
MSNRTIAKLLHWSLLLAALLTVISGLGITEYRTVEALTFGLLNKANAFRLHLWVWIPFLVLLTAHAVLTARPKWFRRRR